MIYLSPERGHFKRVRFVLFGLTFKPLAGTSDATDFNPFRKTHPWNLSTRVFCSLNNNSFQLHFVQLPYTCNNSINCKCYAHFIITTFSVLRDSFYWRLFWFTVLYLVTPWNLMTSLKHPSQATVIPTSSWILRFDFQIKTIHLVNFADYKSSTRVASKKKLRFFFGMATSWNFVYKLGDETNQGQKR